MGLRPAGRRPFGPDATTAPSPSGIIRTGQRRSVGFASGPATPCRQEHSSHPLPPGALMSIPDLAAVLWRQRELLERLVYRLECEQLLMAAGRTRFLGMAPWEVETLVSELRVLELQRAAAAERAAIAAGLNPELTLEELAA